MQKDVKKHPMTNNQLFILSQNVCQWWKVVFIQADRFFNVLNTPIGGTPWDSDENKSLFIADRMFLIMAIYHAVETLQKLDIELQRDNDNSLKYVLQDIEIIASWNDLKNLRDMNEHHLDYLVEKGRKQNNFCYKVKKENDEDMFISAVWTNTNHDTGVILVGNVDINKLLYVMKKHLDFIQMKTKEIFDTMLFEKK